MEDLPEVLSDVPAVLYDFNTGGELASGHANITFVPHTDRLRVRRQLFEGTFVPDPDQDVEDLRRQLLTGLSQGAPAMSMQVDFADETWVFVVKLEMGDLAFPFTGRAEPKRL
ncbi:hypothetical protein LLH23_23340 [bacterium]|nr:hypothetical protein [bacterium]